MVERRIKWIFDPIHLGKDFVTIFSVVDKYGFRLINGDANQDLEWIDLTICAKEKEDRYAIRFYSLEYSTSSQWVSITENNRMNGYLLEVKEEESGEVVDGEKTLGSAFMEELLQTLTLWEWARLSMKFEGCLSNALGSVRPLPAVLGMLKKIMETFDISFCDLKIPLFYCDRVEFSLELIDYFRGGINHFTELINILDDFLYAHRMEVEKGYVDLKGE
nr:MAG TPA: hypothetical protein [Caudoviricetes sp.]